MTEELGKSVAIDEHLQEMPDDDRYGRVDLNHDYVTNGQIMVTITLSEYRSLVKTNADLKVSEASSKMYELRKERDDLQKQLNDLKTMIASAVPVKVAADKDGNA